MSVMTHWSISSGAGVGIAVLHFHLLFGPCQHASAFGSSPTRFDVGVEECFPACQA